MTCNFSLIYFLPTNSGSFIILPTKNTFLLMSGTSHQSLLPVKMYVKSDVLLPFISIIIKSFPMFRVVPRRQNDQRNGMLCCVSCSVPDATATGDVCLESGTGHQVSSITCVFNRVPRANHSPNYFRKICGGHCGQTIEWLTDQQANRLTIIDCLTILCNPQ